MNSERGTSGASSAGLSTAEASDEEEESSSSSHNDTMEDALDTFREKWKKELAVSKLQNQKKEPHKTEDVETSDVEKTARAYFHNGSEMERAGKLYEAIQFYRRAVQLVPDIEFRLDPKSKPKRDFSEEGRRDENKSIRDITEEYHNNDPHDALEDDERHIDLLQHFQKKYKSHCICVPEKEQMSTHISALPMEIILYILRWVVSSDLDVRSLEMCSRASRGFYLCCRDSEIWKLICAKTWSLNHGILPTEFSSWRQMYVDRARLLFNGCYISKTTYIRHGENSFQDQFYRPWHIVTYYRYLRFFPEGVVLMLTTADDPAQCVSQLKHRAVKSPAILSGHYRLKDDKVFLVVQHDESPKLNLLYKRGRKRDAIQDVAQQTFHLEMQIQNYKNKKHIQLVWTGYSVYTRNRNGTETTCVFELVGNRFPPLWFSRVKSYTAEAYSPLE